jgi:hypothetical protein
MLNICNTVVATACSVPLYLHSGARLRYGSECGVRRVDKRHELAFRYS